MTTSTVSRRNVLKGASAGGLAAVAAAAPAAAAEQPEDGRRRRPNVVVVYVDDLGYGDLGCYGSPLIRTPVLDGMARRGMRFTDFYSGAPTCTPSRAALLTGAYAARVNMPRVLFPVPRNADDGLAQAETTLPEYLRREGYRTAMFGKWHLGDPRADPGFHPMDHGFERFFGIPYSNDMDPLPLYDDREVVEEPPSQESLTRRLSEQAVEFVRAHADEPFFVYLAHPQPHEPLAAEAAGRSAAGPHGDSVEEIDGYLGLLLDELDALGIREDTCVMFSSDNGPWFVGSPGDLHGRKAECYEGGMRVPLVVEWPAVVPRGLTYREPAQVVDVLPTVLAALDVEPDPYRRIDGTSLLPALQTGRRVDRGDVFYYDDLAPAGHLLAVRRGDWKLHVGRVPGPYFTGRRYDPVAELPQLFNLRRDEQESYDLAEHYPDVVAELTARIEEFDAELRADHAARYLSLTVFLPEAVGGRVDRAQPPRPTLTGPSELALGARVLAVRVDGQQRPTGRRISLARLELGEHLLEVDAEDAAGQPQTLSVRFLLTASLDGLESQVRHYRQRGAIPEAAGRILLRHLARAATEFAGERPAVARRALRDFIARARRDVRWPAVIDLLVNDALSVISNHH